MGFELGFVEIRCILCGVFGEEFCGGLECFYLRDSLGERVMEVARSSNGRINITIYCNITSKLC